MAVFLIIAFGGLLLLLVAAVFGGEHGLGDHDIGDHDLADHDVGDHGMDHAGGPSPFSLRIISLFLAVFGSTGAIAFHATTSYWWGTGTGMCGGLAGGYLGLMLMRFFYSQQATSSVGGSDVVGKVGQVKTAIPAGGVGQVSVVVKDQRFYPMARCKGSEGIEEGAAVKILEYLGDSVTVERVEK